MRSSNLRAMQQVDECVREEKRQSSGENMGYYYSDNDDMPYVGKKSPAFPRTRSNFQTMQEQEQSFNDEQEEEEEVGQEEEEYEEEENDKSLIDKQIAEEHEVRKEEHSSATRDNKDDHENENEDEDEEVPSLIYSFSLKQKVVS